MKYDLKLNEVKSSVKYHTRNDRTIRKLYRADYSRFYLSGNNYFAKHMGKKLDEYRSEFLDDKFYSDENKIKKKYERIKFLENNF